MRIMTGLLLAVALALPGAAAAQTDFTADDIVDHFKPTEDGKPKSRGITFGPSGTADEDTTALDDPKKPAGPAVSDPSAFNLSVTFEFNSYRLTGRAQRNLREFAKALSRTELQNLRFAVDGHTDAAGSEGYNMNLSERRAEAVVEFLKAQGIDTARLSARGYGESKPATDNPRDPANRRVETRLLTE